MAAVLADANLLVYAHDPSDPVKQSRAIDVLAHLHSAGIGRLSSQTLAEFFAVSTGGKKRLLTAMKAAQQVENLASSWMVFDITPLLVIEAVRGVRSHRFLYWDSQLWATARLNQIPTIFTEDFNSAQRLRASVSSAHFPRISKSWIGSSRNSIPAAGVSLSLHGAAGRAQDEWSSEFPGFHLSAPNMQCASMESACGWDW